VANPVRAGERRPPRPARLVGPTAFGRPLLARVQLQIERPELVEAHHHIRIAALFVDLAVAAVVEVQDPVLLDLVVGSLDRLKVFTT